MLRGLRQISLLMETTTWKCVEGIHLVTFFGGRTPVTTSSLLTISGGSLSSEDYNMAALPLG